MIYKNGKHYDKCINSSSMKFLYFEVIENYLNKYLPGSGKVLDAGGGTGEFSIRVAKMSKNLHLVNCDVSKGMLKQAQNKIEKEGLHNKIENKVGDIMDLPFEDESFDYVMCLGDAFSFCEDSDKAFSEFVRVVRWTGRIHISVNSFWRNFLLMMEKGESENFYFSDVLKYYDSHIIHQNKKSMGCKSFTIEELEMLGKEYDLQIIKEFASPVLWAYEKWLNEPKKLLKIQKLQYELCENKNLLNFGDHLNIIYEK